MIIEYFLDWMTTAPVDKRVRSAGALVRAYFNNNLEEDEREDVEAALTVLLDDKSEEVRMELATSFGARSSAPKHIMYSLAGDSEEVSRIVLSCSPVFHDCELIEFIKTGDENKQIAISCRPWLSAGVVAAICEYGTEDACMGILTNPVVEFLDQHLHTIAVRFADVPQIRDNLSAREDLAAETRLLLITRLSLFLSSLVAGKEMLNEEEAAAAAREACDKAAITFAATVCEDDVERIARSLIEEDRLTVSFLLRAVCMGNIMLAAHAFSILSGVGFSRIESILTRDRQAAFKAVYDRAGLPKSAFSIFACAISIWRRLLTSGSKINQSRMPFLVTREVLEMYSGDTDEIVDELMLLLRRLSAETARENAKSKAAEMAKRGQEALQNFHAGQSVEMLQLEGGEAIMPEESVAGAILSVDADIEDLIDIDEDAFNISVLDINDTPLRDDIESRVYAVESKAA